MNPEQELRVEELFHLLSPLPPSERAKHWKQDEDPAVRDRVQALLEVHDQKSILDQPP